MDALPMIANGIIIDDKYQIEEAIGTGGFGAVYRAVQKQFDRQVAIKILDTTLLLEPDGLPRFEREAKSIGSLKHKNIVALYGYGAWQQAPYMVMELVQGTSVERLIQSERIVEPMRALRIIKQVFEGLGCAHSGGVIHRDLKPSNIMISEDAESNECVKLIDFGLAKLMPGYGIPGQKLTETGYAVGTCHYMAPEQALGGIVDGRSDIYAAGCILYQMLTGRPPFDGEDNTAIMHLHLSAQPIALSNLLPREFPVAAISSLIENCIAKDASNRYQQCKDAITDIERIIDGKFSQVTPLSARPMKSMHTVPSSNRVRLVAPIIGLTTLVLLGGSAYKWFSDREQDRLARNEGARNVVQAAMRTGISILPSTVRELERVKLLDDEEHFLSKSERYYVLVDLGRAYLKLRPAIAEAYADEAAAMLPEAVHDGYRHVCDVIPIYVKLNNEKKMLDTLTIAERTPDVGVKFEARTYFIMYYLNHHRLDLCETYAKMNEKEKSTSIYASPTISNMMLAMVKFFQQDLDAAEKYYRVVSEVHDEPDSWMGLARCALFAHDYPRAIEMTEQAQEAQNRHSSAIFKPGVILRAAALHYLGKEKEASLVESSVSGDPENPLEVTLLSRLDQRILMLARKRQPLKITDVELVYQR
jgi:serine/threonine protein kinase